MAIRIALLSDIHGNAVAAKAVRKAIKRERPDHVIVAGDLVLNGPDPAGAIAEVRELEQAGALVVSGNTDLAVADADYTAAFPWLPEVPDSYKYAAEWARDALSDEELAWLRRLPVERRIWIDGAAAPVPATRSRKSAAAAAAVEPAAESAESTESTETGGEAPAEGGGEAAEPNAAAAAPEAAAAEPEEAPIVVPAGPDSPDEPTAPAVDPRHVVPGTHVGETMSAVVPRMRDTSRTLVLGVHASPGSQTAGFDPGLDASTILDRLTRTDARLICVGHTHVPEIREFGWKVVVNGGSAGWVFDGDPTASWAMITIDGDEIRAEIRRTDFDTLAVSNALSTRGLPGDVYRAATVRTGKLVR